MINPIIVQACILGILGISALSFLVWDMWRTCIRWKEEGLFDE